MKTTFAIVSLAALVLGACEEKPKPAATKPPAPNATSPGAVGVATLPVGLFLAAEPAGAKPLEELKKTAKAGESVTLRGRIGGIEDPFVAGRAVFTVMGPGIKACSDNPDDHCKTPWDYCCEPLEELKVGTANVEFREAGKIVRSSMKGFHGLDHLKEVVVVGKPEKDAAGNVTVVAKGVYVKG